MVLVCFSVQEGKYRIEGDGGEHLTPIFCTAPQPDEFAQALANSIRQKVHLEIRQPSVDQMRLTFSPQERRRRRRDTTLSDIAGIIDKGSRRRD